MSKLITGIGGWVNSHYASAPGQFNGAAPFHASALFQLQAAGSGVVWNNFDNLGFVGWALAVSAGSLVAQWGTGIGVDQLAVNTDGGITNTWTLATFVWTGTQVELWLNGQLVASKATTLAPSTLAARVGVRSNDQSAPFPGLIAGVTYSTQAPYDLGTYFTEVARTLEIGVAAEGDNCGTPYGPPSNAWQSQLYNATLGTNGLPASVWSPAQGAINLDRVDTAAGCVFIQATPPVFASSGAPSAGGGGGVSGDPNAIGYFDPTGASLIDDPLLTAAPPDQFGRPQIRDLRDLPGAGHGAVWRQGAWQVDGDPQNVIGEGVVIYGDAANGLQDGANGSFARVKPRRFGIRYIIGGVDIGYAWRVDDVREFFTNDTGVVTAQITRATGDAYFGSVRTGGATGALWTAGNGLPEGAVVGTTGDLFTQLDAVGGPVLWCKQSGVATNTGWGALVAMNALAAIYGQMFLGMSSTGQVPTGKLHGSNAGIQYSSDFANRAQARFNQYGANAAGAGITTFKSRGAFGTTAAVQADDLLGRWTTIGISADNTSLNLASLLSIYASGAPTATKVPCRLELELTDLAGNRELAARITSEGELSAKGPIGPGDGSPTGATTGPRWRTGLGSPEGVVTGSPGDIYTDQNGGPNALAVKVSGVTTNTGWQGLGEPITPFSFGSAGGVGYYQANGNQGDAPFGGLVVGTVFVVPRTTVFRALSWNSNAADATTELEVWVNGVLNQVVTLTGASGAVDLATPFVAFQGDTIAIYYAGTGTDPAGSIVTLA